jgi:hypothetical protein
LQWWRGDTRKPERQAARPLELDRVRQEILARAAVHPPSPAVAALERLFAGTVSVLLGSDPSLQWQAALHPYDFSTERLKAHAYQTWVGERLAGLRAALDDDAPAVADFWQAAQEFARWLVETLDAAREQGGLVFDGRRGRWLTEIATVATDFCRTARYLESPGGTAIAVFGIPQTMCWQCCITIWRRRGWRRCPARSNWYGSVARSQRGDSKPQIWKPGAGIWRRCCASWGLPEHERRHLRVWKPAAPRA